MKLYKVTIKPTANFATPLKGDTIFGQLCWSIKYVFGEGKLKELLANYKSQPFLIISDGFAKGYLPKPSMPMKYLKEDAEKKKENRKKIWLTLNDLEQGLYQNAKDNKEAANENKDASTVKNSIDYRSFSTGEDFTPFIEDEYFISEQDIYFLFDEKQISLEELKQAFTNMALIGYGKNASIGKGRFVFDSFEEVKANYENKKSFMTLAPSILPSNDDLELCFYEPFTRFGKHGGELANKHTFKRPLLLADSKAVLLFKEVCDKKYIGQAIENYSANKETVHQAYSIIIPIKEIK